MISTAIITILSVWAHELGHAAMSVASGDRLGARRWTWKPLVNLDPILTFLFVLASSLASGGVTAVGMGRPFLLERPNILILMAGPMVNFYIAVICFIGQFYTAAWINLSLAVFNLLPIKPLDGWGIWTTAKQYREFKRAVREITEAKEINAELTGQAK